MITTVPPYLLKASIGCKTMRILRREVPIRVCGLAGRDARDHRAQGSLVILHDGD